MSERTVWAFQKEMPLLLNWRIWGFYISLGYLVSRDIFPLIPEISFKINLL